MGKRVSIAVGVTLGVSFVIGAGCASIPDTRKIQPTGFSETDAGSGGANGSTGGKSGAGGGSAGGAGGGSAAGGGSGAGGLGAGGGVVSTEGGTVTEGGSAEGGGPVGIKCGTKTCSDRQVGGASLTACCAGTKGDLCGFETGALGVSTCLAVNQPGNLDKSCNNFAVGNDNLRGCCQPNGTCGLMVEPPGGPHYGCIDASIAGVTTTSTCTPPVCKAAGAACNNSSDCCAGGAGQPVCATLGSATTSSCTQYCVTNGDCPSGCCVELISGRGACSADASACKAVCRKAEHTCDTDADCCSGLVCAPNGNLGPRLCEPPCTKDADCAPEYCVKDSTGRAACSATGSGMCSDSCKWSNDGACDDGGPNHDYSDCTLGTDCTDCKTARLGGTSRCSDTCATAKNGVCEDGGFGSTAYSCNWGSDCTDCKMARLGICDNSCSSANDGFCDDGGQNADTSDCNFGTDCADCGSRHGGRGQEPCDGSYLPACNSGGGLLNYDVNDGSCECPDCAWDAGKNDCATTTTKCDGKSISTCCAPGNPCNFDGDGVCDCGGWCGWEKKDCGPGASGERCDGLSVPFNATDCKYPNPGTASAGYCDCDGVCSWETADCTANNIVTICKDTCGAAHVNNGICEDGGLGSILPAVCTKGTDCVDCGPR